MVSTLVGKIIKGHILLFTSGSQGRTNHPELHLQKKSMVAIIGVTWEISALIVTFLGHYKYLQVRLYKWEQMKKFSLMPTFDYQEKA